jgi:hypothetical protein
MAAADLSSLGPAPMRTILVLLGLAIFGMLVHATSYHFSLQQKVKRCRAILRVTVTEAQPPATDSLIEPAICRATVGEVLKGPKSMKEVEFRFIPYGDFKLKELVGQTYFVFLHELDGRYWVFEGPAGLRPISPRYQESRLVGDKLVEENYDHQQFVTAIRKFVGSP